MRQYRLSDRAVRFGLKPLVFAVSLTPLASLAWDAWTHQLNANPFNAIVRDTGFWSLRFLCLTLAVTPLRWLTGWHPIVKFRRMIGLFGFFYGAVHVVAYVVFDRIASREFWAIGADLVRPFFYIGLVAFVLMLPLAATSTVGMMHRLGGRRWQALHRLVYPAAIASVVHTYWPLTTRTPRYGVIVGIVLVLRLGRAYAMQHAPQDSAMAPANRR